MLGNDIVDLEQVLRTGQASRVGFRERICTIAELSPLQKHFSTTLSIWILWALKESAYKCYIQAGGLPLFAPKKFTARLESIHEKQLSASLQTPMGAFDSQILVENSFLLAESWRNELPTQKIHRETRILNTSLQKDKSILLKKALCKHFAEMQQLDMDELEVRKNKQNIPTIHLGERKLPYTISLSHHGRWGLFSYRNENSPFLG